MSLRDRAGWYLTLAEAAALLCVAALLIRHMRFGWWRRTLGNVADVPQVGRPPGGIPPAPRRIVRAIDRASRFRRAGFACLPRAMALQWMLGRRGQRSTLIFGTTSGAMNAPRDLHAWVEIDGVVAIGGGTVARHIPAFALTQR